MATACCLAIGFCLRLTALRPDSNHLLRSVCVMTPYVTSCLATRTTTSGEVLTGGPSALISPPGSDLGVRPGESDSTRMLGAVLLLTVATTIVGLVRVWVW